MSILEWGNRGGHSWTIELLFLMAGTQQEVPWKDWSWQKNKANQFQSWLENLVMKYCIVWALTVISLRQDFFRYSLKLSIKKQYCNSYKDCAPTPLKCRRLVLGETLQVHMEKNPLHRLATTAINYLHFDIKHATNRLCVGTRCGLHLRMMSPLSWNTPMLYHQEKYDGNQIKIFHKLISIVSLNYLSGFSYSC